MLNQLNRLQINDSVSFLPGRSRPWRPTHPLLPALFRLAEEFVWDTSAYDPNRIAPEPSPAPPLRINRWFHMLR